MIGHRTLLRENEDLPLLGAPAFMKKPPCCYVRALITLEFIICKVMMRNGVLRNNLKKEGRKVGNGARVYSLPASD